MKVPPAAHCVSDLLIALLLIGCSHQENASSTPPAEQPKDDIIARVGETFEIRLPANPTTSYRWIIAPAVDEKIIQLQGQEYFRTGANLPGAGGEEIWKFKAVGSGKTTITMGYIRPWEQPMRPVKGARFHVRVE